MAKKRMDRQLFNWLRQANIFKDWQRSGNCSEKTEQRRLERDRSVMLWHSKGHSTDPITKTAITTGRGTFRGNILETFKGIKK